MSKGSFRDLFTMGEDRHLHRTILAYVNQMFQQISGINLITYYAATIYQNQIGLSGLTSRALAAANGTGMLVNTSAIVWRSWKTDILRFQSTSWLRGLLYLPLKDSAGAHCKQRFFFNHIIDWPWPHQHDFWILWDGIFHGHTSGYGTWKSKIPTHDSEFNI